MKRSILTVAITALIAGSLLVSYWLPSLVPAAVSLLVADKETVFVEHGNVCFDLSPSGDSIVFSSVEGDLFLFDLTTKNVKQLTKTDHVESCPSFSPDGLNVVYASSKAYPSPCGIFTIDLESGEITRLTGSKTNSDFYPRYSPDGRTVYFARSNRCRPYSFGGWRWVDWDVCSVVADGSGFSRLTTESYLDLYRVMPRDDGSLVFAATTELRSRLFTLSPPDKPRLLQVEKGDPAANLEAWMTDPVISADEKQIAFISDREKPYQYDICLFNDAGDVKCLRIAPRYNSSPDFFPDGKRLIFLAGKEFNAGSRAKYSLWIVTTEGTVTEVASSDLFTCPERWLMNASTL